MLYSRFVEFIHPSELKVYIKLKNLFLPKFFCQPTKVSEIPQLRNKTKEKNFPGSTKFSLLSLKSYDSGKRILSRAMC